MTKEDCFAAWAPEGAVWSPWAKPVSFTQLDQAPAPPSEPLDWEAPEAGGWPAAGTQAVVLDLPGEDSIRVGLALARLGYRPVPLLNATHGPSPVLEMGPVLRRLLDGAERLGAVPLRPDAPPAFLLDAQRMEPKTEPAPGRFDNRWITLPQDFPSATLLRSHGLSQALLVQRGRSQPREDLSHVLRRWQEGGLRLLSLDVAAGGAAAPLDVPRPSLFRHAWYAALTVFGRRRNNVGGFGSAIPQAVASSGRGFHGGFG
jgi:hypothetical protein